MTMADEKILMVMMAVTDMAKAKAFYAEQLGWSVTTDYGQGDQHWVSLELPGGGATLTLSTMHGKMKPGTMTLYLSTSDIEATYHELKAKGLHKGVPTAQARESLVKRSGGKRGQHGSRIYRDSWCPREQSQGCLAAAAQAQHHHVYRCIWFGEVLNGV